MNSTWNTLLRLCGPRQPWFDKVGEIELVEIELVEQERAACAEQEERRMLARAWMLAALLAVPASVVLAQGPPPEAKAVLEACKQDIAHFCSQVPPGEGRIKACMKAHLHELSEPCKEALFKAWLQD